MIAAGAKRVPKARGGESMREGGEPPAHFTPLSLEGYGGGAPPENFENLDCSRSNLRPFFYQN